MRTQFTGKKLLPTVQCGPNSMEFDGFSYKE